MTDRQENRQTDRPAERQGDRTMKEIISDAVERQLKKDPSEDMSLEEFAAMIERAESRRRKRRLKWMSIAAMFLLAIVGATLALNTLTTDVGANKNEKEEIVTEDGVVIEDGGWGSSDGEDTPAYVVTDWDEIEIVKGVFPQLLIPEYIPNGYVFESLSSEKLEANSAMMEYFFYNEADERIEIEILYIGNGEWSLAVSDVSDTVETAKGIVFIQDMGESKKATIRTNDGNVISIWSNLIDEEIIKIIEKLRN